MIGIIEYKDKVILQNVFITPANYRKELSVSLSKLSAVENTLNEITSSKRWKLVDGFVNAIKM